MSMVAWQTV